MRYTDHNFLNTYPQLLTLSELDRILDDLALDIMNDYDQKTPLIIGVMNGALITTGHLLTKLDMAVDSDYCHATRYNNTTRGGQLRWLAYPQHALANRDVLLVDDIFDEGITLKLIADYCREQGAASVRSAVLLNKEHDRKVSGFDVDYIGTSIPDRYVFGFGLDYEGQYRNAPGIFSLS